MKMSFAFVSIVMLIATCIACADEIEPPNALINSEFELGLDGWRKQGNVDVVSHTAQTGKTGARIGPTAGALQQTVRVGALRIVYFGVTLGTSAADIEGIVCVRCYDSGHKLVMEQKQPIDAKQAALGSTKPGIYFKTHGRTAYIVASVEKEPGAEGFIYLNSAQLNVTEEASKHEPACSLDEYMHPFWKGNDVCDETVLMLAKDGKPATGALMYTPRRIISVRSLSPPRKYVPGRDYTVSGNVITCTPNSRLPVMRNIDFEAGDLKWFDLAGKHVLVTYTHEDIWHGRVSTYQGSRLPHTMSKLAARSPLVIAATGDSITLGTGTSGVLGRPPFMPTWAELFVRRVRQLYGYTARNRGIRLYNTALGGTTSDWGRESVASAVASLKPDLVLIAFGMNDFWWMPADRFRDNVSAIMNEVRSKSPNAEFVLVASTRFDPAYALDPQYQARLASYTPALRSLTGQGIVLLDMDAISGALAAAKKPKDLLSDPLHPNDFLARWYAQSMAALFDNTP
jgi:lysophospholipase L1-like esterase